MTNPISTAETATSLVTSPLGTLAILTGVAAFFFMLEKRTAWKLFEFFPPLLFIYALPVVLSNVSLPYYELPVITNDSHFVVYQWMRSTVLPMFLLLMLLDVDVVAAVRVMGRGVVVMFCGTAGIVFGAPIAYMLVKNHLSPDAWKAFGTLAGSWIGGTGNMAAVSDALDTSPADFGLAVVADNAVYIVWLPLLLTSKKLAPWFNRVVGVNPKRIEMLEQSAADLTLDKGKLDMRHVLYLLFLGFACTWASSSLASVLPRIEPIVSEKTWSILLITIMGIGLSMTPAKRIPGSHQIAVALVFIYVAMMGAKADIAGAAGQAPWFVLGAFIWIAIHGLCCLVGAWVLKVDIHCMAIASAANIGGIASAPIVAAYHNDKLVPVSILMALIGYAVGNFAALLAAALCRMV